MRFAYTTPARFTEELRQGFVRAHFARPSASLRSSAWVLQDVSLKIETGMRVGLLGPSGAGKTSLLSLAMRLYDLPAGTDAGGGSSGSVRLDGVDVSNLRLADVRRAVALVPQQAMLFDGTIRSNLIYAQPQATPARIRLALEIADLASLVDSLPHGLETPVNERGFSLSGGQRQRLALARAILSEPSVLLLDDCTSALDAETEARIQQALDRHLPGRTCLIVSHKVSSVRRCDWIVILEHGRIIEQGTPHDLLGLHSRYATMYSQQTRSLSLAPRSQVLYQL